MSTLVPSDVCWVFLFFFAFLHCNSFSHYLASLAETEGRRQKIDDLSIQHAALAIHTFSWKHIQHAALAIHTFSWKHTHILSLLRWPCCCSLNILLCQLLPSFVVSYLSTCSAVLPAGGIVAMNNNKMASIAQCGVTSESLSTSSSLMVSAKCNT